jgi:hypothetical protein
MQSAGLLGPQRVVSAYGRVEETVFSVVLAASPPKQPKKIVTSLLPQAKKAIAAGADTPTA